jgi:hypothetical protein
MHIDIKLKTHLDMRAGSELVKVNLTFYFRCFCKS